jgi:hypothetical protein
VKKITVSQLMVFVFLLIVSCNGDKQNSTVLEGQYTGKNIFVQNPFAANGIGFCVKEIYINGKITSDEVNSASFEIDLLAAGLKEGNRVKIELKHSKECSPKILNPEVLK